MCNMYIVGEYGGGTGWNERRDGCLEGTPNWRIARFGWDVFVEGRDFCFGGTRNWRESAVWLDVFVEGRDFCFGGTRN